MPGRLLILNQPADAEMHPAFGLARRASDLIAIIDEPGLLVMAAPNLPHLLLPRSRGVILGRLFSHDGRSWTPGGKMLDAIAGSGGTVLLDSVWGQYLAIVRHGPGRLFVMRDPSGAIPCYILSQGVIVALADDLRRVGDLAFEVPGIDRDRVRDTLLFRDLRGRRTCLTGVGELIPGELTLVADGRISSTGGWRPVTAAAAPAPVTMDEANALVGRAVRNTVAALASGFAAPLVTVSGGLDSSIVASALTEAGAKPRGVTFVHPGPEGDERSYVAALATFLGMTVEAVASDADMVDLDRSLAADLPWPAARSLSQARERIVSDIARRRSCDVIFTGNGGDAIFGYSYSALPVHDCWRATRSWRRAGRVVDEIAALHDVTIWEVLRRAWRTASRAAPAWRPVPDFLKDGHALARENILPAHPWLDGLDALPPAKAAQVRALTGQYGHHEAMPVADRIPVLSPLCAQPVVEACLAIPAWYNVTGGRDRAVARGAFDASLPTAISRRRTKGGPDGLCQSLFRRHRSHILERLLDGRLAQWDIIDRAAIEGALAKPRTDAGPLHYQLLCLLDVETWIRAREAKRDRAAATAERSPAA